MSKLLNATAAEWMKIRKSKIFIISIAAMCLFPFICGIFLIILLHPEFASSGLLAQKAKIAETADWSSYFDLLSEMMSIGGLLIFGFLTSWIFGREYSDRTAKDLLALPLPRSMIINAKFIALVVWCLMLTCISLIFALIQGFFINLPDFSYQMLLDRSLNFVVCSALTILLSTPVAFFASYGKGYLPPLGFVILAILIAQVVEMLGIGAYFPWILPAVYAGIANDVVSFVHYMIYVIVVASGIGATYAWWRYADQK